MGSRHRRAPRRAQEGRGREEHGEAEGQEQEVTHLWSGRFSKPLDPRIRAFTSSLEWDKRIARCDVRGSLAHARMLASRGLLTAAEGRSLCDGLARIDEELAGGTFPWPAQAEDVHSAVEQVLSDRLGAVSGKLHTARSRNDQVALDLRLLVVELLDDLDAALLALGRALVGRAAAEVDTVLPGYTHLQRAQPVSLAHHLLAHTEALRRDRERVAQARARAAVS
ncbi:MAG: argininosuccinate lyase, partial [Chloroflexi bacterium]|nr:argininosuccinate lyase [Chloroflexota bacterium]